MTSTAVEMRFQRPCLCAHSNQFRIEVHMWMPPLTVSSSSGYVKSHKHVTQTRSSGLSVHNPRPGLWPRCCARLLARAVACRSHRRPATIRRADTPRHGSPPPCRGSSVNSHDARTGRFCHSLHESLFQEPARGCCVQKGAGPKQNPVRRSRGRRYNHGRKSRKRSERVGKEKGSQ
jgi:hypothetical protein